jgi:arsenite methyltransferase
MPTTRDNLRSTRTYRRAAAAYLKTAGRTWPIRMRCIELLKLDPGDCVLDVGCGTGLSFEPILEKVGRSGSLVAFEQNPHLFRQAELRAQGLIAQGWNIELLCASATDVRFKSRPDAALFHYVHDISRTPEAVRNLFEQLPPGTRIAIAGMKSLPWWLAPLNLVAWLKNRPYKVPASEMRKPWSLIEPHLQSFNWKPTQGGMGYIGSGRVRGTGP